MQEVVKLALNRAAGLEQVNVTALFSLGNMANHPAMLAEMQKLQIEQGVERMVHERATARNAQRLMTKLRGSGGRSGGERPSTGADTAPRAGSGTPERGGGR